MIQCSHCGTQNRDGSKFCSDCGARLAQQSGLVCPMCSTPNTVENVFCIKCGARLVPLTVAPLAERMPPPAPIKGLSLPAKPAEPSAPTAPATPPAPEATPNAAPPKGDDWLARLRTQTLEKETPDQPTAAPPLETPPPASEPTPAPKETTEWLAGLRATAPAEEEASTEPTPRAQVPEIEIAEEDLPDWLRSTPAPPAQESATPSSTEDEIPDWLKSAGSSPATEPAAPPVEESTWFKPVTPAPETPRPVPAVEAEIPDWLKAIKPEEKEPAAPIRPITEEPATPIHPATEEPTVPIRPTIKEPAIGEELLEALEMRAPAPVETEKPTWLTELQPVGADEEEDLPDWLRSPAAGKPAQAVAETPAEAAPALELTAKVPDWIAVLKPVEQAVPGAFISGTAEASGPLAGLRGVLPLASAVIEPHAPPKPRLPSPFKENAHLFSSILAAPAIASAVPAAKKARVWTLRPFIYLLLLLAILIPFFIPDLASSSARPFGAPATDFADLIQALPPNAIVVLSFDYDPGSAGEMDLQANALVRHLMQRRVKIVTISTLDLTGPQIAQRVLDDAARASGNYTYGANYLNLGYIAGQEAGLAQLATTGFVPTTQDYLKNQTLGKYPEFTNLRSWRNVALLIELAGSPEPLQKWMEQVQRRAGVPIAAGVSAAVEPRARAYRNAKQLVAMMSGAMGAAQYEVLSNQHGLAFISAGAQSAAQLVLVGLIVLGNLVYWFTRGRGKTK